MVLAGPNHVSFAPMPPAARLGLAVAFLAPAIALAQGTPEQRAACQPDAMRPCGEFAPDVDAITACMQEAAAAHPRLPRLVRGAAQGEILPARAFAIGRGRRA